MATIKELAKYCQERDYQVPPIVVDDVHSASEMLHMAYKQNVLHGKVSCKTFCLF